MKVLVTGAAGQLGHDVMNELYRRGHEGIGAGITAEYDGVQDGTPAVNMPYVQMDITDAKTVERLVLEIKPDAVVHCAAWTAVDLAEEPERQEEVRAINVLGTEYIAKVCAEVDSKLIYLSTDYVFDGKGTEPWDPDCKDFHPLNFYGQTKLEGEMLVERYLQKYFIVRIAWVFGVSGKNFVRTMLQLGKTKPEVRVVKDQIGTPTYTFDLARLLVDMVEGEEYGYYHATNEGGYISWYEFTCEIFRQAGLTARVIPVTTEEYGLSKATRPFNSRLDKQKLAAKGFTPLPTWKDALCRYLKEIEV